MKRRKVRNLLVASLFASASMQAQIGFLPLEISLSMQGDTLASPWLGGWAAPQFSPIDLNNDGKEDLIVYDRMGQIVMPFLNTGGPGEVSYTYAREFQSAFPQRGINFMRTYDYNCDGIQDLMVFNQLPTGVSGIGVLRGSYDAQNRIQFSTAQEVLRYMDPPFPPSEIFIYNPDLPAFGDVDGDGDMDVLAFSLDFSFIGNVFYYKNLSAERGYACDSLIFELEHKCWGMFSEQGSNNAVALSPGIDSCALNPYWRSARHTGSSLTMLDWNGDGAMDLLMGDVSVNTLNLLTSNEIRDTNLVITQDSTYPSYSTPVDMFTFPAAYIMDVNNDGKRDMIVATNSTDFGEAIGDSVAWLYLNTQSDTHLNFALSQKDFMLRGNLDFGQGARPYLVDYDNDGDLDLLVGNTGYCSSQGDVSSRIRFFRNTGTANVPHFDLELDNLANLDTLNLLALHPTMGDLDGDGDLDLLLGTSVGSLVYVRNIGTRSNPIWDTPILDYKNINIGQGNYAAPQLIDMDRDGDLDLMIGSNFNNLYYFENTGSTSNPNFVQRSNAFGIDLNSLGSARSIPCFYDRNGNYELFLGHQTGGVIHLNHIDGNITGLYDTLSMDYGQMFTGYYSSVSVGDLDGDDSLDFVIGNVRGGLTIFSSNPDLGVGVSTLATTRSLGMTLFPNPSTGNLQLRLPRATQGQASYRIVDALGRLCQTGQLAEGEKQHNLNLLESLPQGNYFLQYIDDKGMETQNFSFLRP